MAVMDMTSWRQINVPEHIAKALEEIKTKTKKKALWNVIEFLIRVYIEEHGDDEDKFIKDIQEVLEKHRIPVHFNLLAFFRLFYRELKGKSPDEAGLKAVALIEFLRGNVKQNRLIEEIHEEEQSLKELGITGGEEEGEEPGEPPAYEVIDGEKEEEVIEEETKEFIEELKRKAQAGDEEAKRLLALFTAMDQGLL